MKHYRFKIPYRNGIMKHPVCTKYFVTIRKVLKQSTTKEYIFVSNTAYIKNILREFIRLGGGGPPGKG